MKKRHYTHIQQNQVRNTLRNSEMAYKRTIDEIRVTYFQSLIRNGVPIPAITVWQMPDGRWDVIDGIQRLEAFRREMGDDALALFLIAEVRSEEQAAQLRTVLNRVSDTRGVN